MNPKAPRPQHAPTPQGAALCGQRDRTGTVPIRVPTDRPWELVSCLKCLRLASALVQQAIVDHHRSRKP